MKQLLQNMRDGKIEVADVPVPIPQTGMLLVRNAASLVSAGTERMLVEFAGKSLLEKARSRPDLVKQVIDKARREGWLSSVEAAFNRLDQPMTLGYSCAGTVAASGEGVQGYKIGQRVACAGGGYAVHAEYVVVPVNLAVTLPDDVDFESAAFTTLGAIAMHGFHLGGAQLGERVAVIGLGLLGLLTIGIAKAAGCRVIGIDLDPKRVELARKLGAEAVARQGAEEAVLAFTGNQGADVVLICADSESNDPVELAGEVARERGRVVAVGAVGMDIPRRTYYYKELDVIVSRSYGPGRYDPDYEEGGHDYPAAYVRWTAGRNMAGFVELLAGKQLDITSLITHRIPVEDAAEAYDLITGKSDESFLGVVLTYPGAETSTALSRKIVVPSERKISGSVKLGVLGAGLYAKAVILPIMKKQKETELVGIASASGTNASHAAKKFGFRYASSDGDQLIQDPEVNTLAVLTRHHLHAEQTLAGLRAGKHVFCEKPLAMNNEQLEEIESQLQQPDCPLLMVGYNRRFAPLAIQLKTFLDERHEPLMAYYRVNAGLLPLSHWTHDPQQGGGRIIGEGCHFIDFLLWLVGEAPKNVSVTALPDNGKYKQDNVQVTMTFPDGSIGTVVYLANGDKAFSKERVEVFTGGKVAVLDDFNRLEMVQGGRRKVKRTRLRQDKGHRAGWAVFINAIINGGRPPIPYSEMMASMRAVFATAAAIQGE